MNPPAPITHYENFPVASLLCPPALRAPITAIYHFARTADDLADEGDATPEQRLAELSNFHAQLRIASAANGELDARWRPVFVPLRIAIQQFQLPTEPLAHLLSAFMQDIEKTRDGSGYDNEAELLDYCSRSANPVGRLLLHLYGVTDAASLRMSDAICSALQLINFWQDLSVDIPRQRYYLPHNLCRQFSVTRTQIESRSNTPTSRALVQYCVTSARTLMISGASLVHRVPGRAGWELRLVVQGGLRILDKIDALQYNTLQIRPTLRWWDAPILLWRAWRM
jgi:squalene synthase HpnC